MQHSYIHLCPNFTVWVTGMMVSVCKKICCSNYKRFHHWKWC